MNNRALALLGDHRYEEAVALLDRALARQPDEQLLSDNRRAAVMRWAQPAFQSGDYAEAIRRTTWGVGRGRRHAALVANVRHGYSRWIAALRKAGRTTRRNESRGGPKTTPS